MSAIPTTALSLSRATAGSDSSAFAHKFILHSTISSFLMFTEKTTSSPAP